MHRRYVGGLAVSLVLAAALPVLAASAESTAKSAGHAIGNAAEATGHVVKQGAEATGHVVKQGAEATGHYVKKGAEATGNMLGITGGRPVTPAEAARYEAAEMGEHAMRGTITKVDHQDGMVHLATEEALLELPFKPASIRSLKDGEKATVQLAYVKLPVAKTAPRHEEAGEEAMQAEHWMKGTVKHLDRKTGIFSLDTADVTARLHFPPSKIVHLQNGDQVAVEVALAQPRR